MRPVSPSYSTSSFFGKRNGDKILSVMEMFGLSDRRIEDCFDGHKCIADNIDFAPVEELRKGYVESSTKFILDALKQAEQSLEG